jgi:hypothetical protein
MVGLVVLAVLGVPFSLGIAILCLAIAIAITAAGAVLAGRRPTVPAS